MPTPRQKAPDPGLGYGSIDKARYLSREFAAREWERVFERCWLYAVPAADVAEPGTFATFDIGPESVIIARTPEGELDAFYNVCQHRGRRLVEAPCGRANAFRCAYHAWTYRLDGSVRTILDREVFPDDLDQASLTIPRVRVDTWGAPRSPSTERPARCSSRASRRPSDRGWMSRPKPAGPRNGGRRPGSATWAPAAMSRGAPRRGRRGPCTAPSRGPLGSPKSGPSPP